MNESKEKKTTATKKIIVIQIFLLICILTALFIWKSALSRNLSAYVQRAVPYEETGSAGEHYTMEINSMDDWLDFSENVNQGRSYLGYRIELNTDLDFADQTYLDPVGSYTSPFEGNFYGNGHTLRNISISSDENYVGVFGYTQGAVIRELNVIDCQLYSYSATGTGGIAGYVSGYVLECSFSGTVEADAGSAGGIAGNNWGCIDDCSVSGEIRGSGVSGGYGGGMSAPFGTGGITGDNSGTVSRCINYAEVSIDSDFYDLGGISGYNQGFIQSCGNFADMNGGGIVDNNSDYAVIRGCFNFGDTYAGIAVGSYSESTIEYCVNLGHTSGRYAAGIVSFWGQDNEENYQGRISQCLSAGTFGNELVRSRYFDSSFLTANYRIHTLSNAETEQLTALLEENEYEEAYGFAAETENQRRNIIFCVTAVGLTLLLAVGDSIYFGRKTLEKQRIYIRAGKLVKEGALREGACVYGTVLDYKDSADRGKSCFRDYLQKCAESGKFEIGRIHGESILWECISRKETEYRLLCGAVLKAECIHAAPEPVSWKNSDLYKKLNSAYRQEWFSTIEQGFLKGEVDLLTKEEAKQISKNKECMRCKSAGGPGDILTGSGCVYWWIRNEEERETARMPFVTGEGLISERGMWNTAENIGVRPVITIKVENEDSI
ncbi:hypothetical protein I6E09_09355 [Mediterraneibacter glycyrrhizinilyticus]|uniref:hypothetical protein n=1 Tax=Mediterraneibacter glycyrrhizinilyticus TaxID=342942 RepID=UPI00265941C6|nr:hypothetical protein [Mediterraneibacter glycyrrhizinilyticus]MCF2569367.1 hypothetical protein [Mediterraneibacter glycyrrhizinilyticus]